jgi:hypothetical protein
MTPKNLKAPLDILERALATYVQTFAGLLVAANIGMEELSDLSLVKTCAVSALPAALSVLKSLSAVSLPFGDKSASLVRVGYERIRRVVQEVPVEVFVERPKKPAAKTTAPVKKKAAAHPSEVKPKKKAK